MDKQALLEQLVRSSNRIVAFTGAGVSAESGIPTYRGQGGYWTRYDPMKYAHIDFFLKDPSYYWNFFRDVRHDLFISARPNNVHLALAKLEKEGVLHTVITQNIDGLHQKASSSNILELHGNSHKFYCIDCGRQYQIEQVWEMLKVQLPPMCDFCGSLIRPDVVLFGEFLDPDVLFAAEKAVINSDLMLAIGSSLQVFPAADLPVQAKQRGAKLVIINLDPTPLDYLSDLVLHEKASDVLNFINLSS